MAARCFIKRDNNILLCHLKSEDFYFLPGGSVEFQEEIYDAIYREFLEEMGIDRKDIKIKNLMAIMEVIYDDVHGVDNIFEVEISQDINITSIESYIDFKWINMNDIEKIDLKPSSLKQWIKNGHKDNHIIYNAIKK